MPASAPPAQNGTAHHHQRSASQPLSQTPGQSTRGSRQSADPVIETNVRRSSSEKLKENSTGFLQKYRAARAARKTRGSKDITNEMPDKLVRVSPRQKQQEKVPDRPSPQMVAQIIADSTQPFLQATSDVKVKFLLGMRSCRLSAQLCRDGMHMYTEVGGLLPLYIACSAAIPNAPPNCRAELPQALAVMSRCCRPGFWD